MNVPIWQSRNSEYLPNLYVNIKTCFIIIIFSLSQQSFYIQVLQENACLCLTRHIFQNTHLREQYLNIDRHLHKTKPWIYFPFSYVMFLLFYHWIKLGTSHKDICIKWLSIRICLKKKRSEGKTKISGNQRSKKVFWCLHFQVRQAWVQSFHHPRTSCVTLGRSPYISEAQFTHLKKVSTTKFTEFWGFNGEEYVNLLSPVLNQW